MARYFKGPGRVVMVGRGQAEIEVLGGTIRLPTDDEEHEEFYAKLMGEKGANVVVLIMGKDETEAGAMATMGQQLREAEKEVDRLKALVRHQDAANGTLSARVIVHNQPGTLFNFCVTAPGANEATIAQYMMAAFGLTFYGCAVQAAERIAGTGERGNVVIARMWQTVFPDDDKGEPEGVGGSESQEGGGQ